MTGVEAVAVPHPVAATAVGSGNAADLALIAQPSIALAQWWRRRVIDPSPDDLATFETIRLEGDIADVGDSLAAELTLGTPCGWHAALADDAAMLAGLFGTIAGCDAIALRLEAVDGDACRRFHADYVRLRLITTYAGPGTEWLIDGDDAPHHRIETGHVAIFKGRDPDPVGLLHRSPPIDGSGVRRLVLAIDPLGRPSWDDDPAFAVARDDDGSSASKRG